MAPPTALVAKGASFSEMCTKPAFRLIQNNEWLRISSRAGTYPVPGSYPTAPRAYCASGFTGNRQPGHHVRPADSTPFRAVLDQLFQDRLKFAPLQSVDCCVSLAGVQLHRIPDWTALAGARPRKGSRPIPQYGSCHPARNHSSRQTGHLYQGQVSEPWYYPDRSVRPGCAFSAHGAIDHS